MILSGRDIVVSSNEPWGDVWYSKHNYAYELSKRNRVLFLNPQGRWRPANFFGCRISTVRITDGLSVVNYNNLLPILNRLLFWINDLLVSRALRRYFRRSGISKPIYWSFDPYRLYAPRRLGAIYSIYHSVDPYKLIPYGEADLCRNADLVLAVKDEIANDYRSLAPVVHVVPHAISGDDFVLGEEPPKLPSMPDGGFGLYIGAIDKRIDFLLLERILKTFPDVPFLFVGALASTEPGGPGIRIFAEGRYPNLHHLGSAPYKSLKFIIAKARFCLAINTILPPHSENFTAHKILQYLALGKPVFLSAPRAQGDSLIYTSQTQDAFIDTLAAFIRAGEPSDFSARRIAYARLHTFDAVFENIEAFIRASKAGPALGAT